MDIFEWIKSNIEWIFSGVGVTVMIVIWNIFFYKGKNITQNQTGGDGTSMQQAGGNINNK